MKYRRKEPCSACGQDYFIDTTTRIGWCGPKPGSCAPVHIHVPSEENLKLFFEPVKK